MVDHNLEADMQGKHQGAHFQIQCSLTNLALDHITNTQRGEDFLCVVDDSFDPSRDDLGVHILKWYYDEKMFSWFSVDSDFIFSKNAPCQLLRLNFKKQV